MALEIQIQGLNKRQQVIADIIWQCNDRKQINAFITSLPTVQLQDEARNIVELMIMATVEQCYDGLSPMTEAQQLIKKVSK